MARNKKYFQKIIFVNKLLERYIKVAATAPTLKADCDVVARGTIYIHMHIKCDCFIICNSTTRVAAECKWWNRYP